MQRLKTAAVAYSLILIIAISTTTVAAQSPAHSPSPATFTPAPKTPPSPFTPAPKTQPAPFTPPPKTQPAPLAPAPFMMPEPPSMGGGVSPSPSPGLDCMPYLLNMSDCLGYVMTGSNDTKPDKKCCQELGSLVDTQPLCLCQLLGNPDKVGFSIDITKALKLPTVCNVTTPPISLCAAIGYPVPGLGPSGAPGPSPAGATFTVPTVAPSPSEPTSDESQSGSPSLGGANSGASNLFFSNLNFFIGIAFLINVVLRY